MKQLLKFLRTMLLMPKYSKKCKASSSSILDGNCSFEGKNSVGRRTVFYSSKMGYASYVGNDNVFVRTKIGRYCSIGNNVEVIYATHPVDAISSYPAFYSAHAPVFSYVNENKFDEFLSTDEGFRCEIGNDVWIGSHVLIRGGVKIGDGAVIAMGSVVTKDVPPYAIVGGVPAKVIRYRFDEEKINSLMKIQWWNKDEKWIRENADLFMKPEEFFEENKI